MSGTPRWLKGKDQEHIAEPQRMTCRRKSECRIGVCSLKTTLCDWPNRGAHRRQSAKGIMAQAAGHKKRRSSAASYLAGRIKNGQRGVP